MDEYTDDHNAYIAQKLSIRRYRSLIVVFGRGVVLQRSLVLANKRVPARLLASASVT